jgi:hypothetical protein
MLPEYGGGPEVLAEFARAGGDAAQTSARKARILFQIPERTDSVLHSGSVVVNQVS